MGLALGAALLASGWWLSFSRRRGRSMTRVPKDGDHWVEVQRQYCGTLGKKANCQLGMSVNAVRAGQLPMDWGCPAESSRATDGRAACLVPEGVRERSKRQLTLDMVEVLDQCCLVPPVLVDDAGYGEVGESG